MSWSRNSPEILDITDNTDHAADLSIEDIGPMHAFNLKEGGLQDLDVKSGEISSEYTAFQRFSPDRNERGKGDTFDKQSYETKWGYQIVSPQEQQEFRMGSSSYADMEEFGESPTRPQWPSLQIECPEPQTYPAVSDDRHPFGSPLGFRGGYSAHSLESPRGPRDRSMSQPAPAKPTPYYPVSPIPEEPMGYGRMSPPYPYSPTLRSSSGSVGYRSSAYGMQVGRGPLPMVSPARSPAVNRRFMEPVDGYIYQVQFKRAHKNFILAPSAPRNIIPGDFVKVEADRGEDMGIVLAKQLATEFEEVIPTAGYRGRGFSSGQGERKFLFRLANAEERAALVSKVQDEERALEVIRAKVLEQRLPMTILDAEYQFDRHKLTFFFEADRRIDFRELVSELFSLYKTRIWMQQVDTSAVGLNDAGAELAKATGFLPQRNDHEYFQLSQMHRMESASGGYGPTAAYQQQTPLMSQYAAPRTPQSAFPSALSAPPAPALGSMGVGLGSETDLAVGLGLTRTPPRLAADTGFGGGSGLELSGGLKLNTALPYGGAGGDRLGSGMWDAPAAAVTPQGSGRPLQPQGSLFSPSQHSMYSPPSTGTAAPFASPTGRFTPQRAVPQPLQVPPYGEQAPQATQPGHYASGYQGMYYEWESLLGTTAPLPPPFTAPPAAPSQAQVPVRQPSRSLGSRSFELNANAPPWPPAAAHERARTSPPKPKQQVAVESSESAEALLTGIKHTNSATSTSSVSSGSSEGPVAGLSTTGTTGVTGSPNVATVPATAATTGSTAATAAASSGVTSAEKEELERLLDPDYDPNAGSASALGATGNN